MIRMRILVVKSHLSMSNEDFLLRKNIFLTKQTMIIDESLRDHRWRMTIAFHEQVQDRVYRRIFSLVRVLRRSFQHRQVWNHGKVYCTFLLIHATIDVFVLGRFHRSIEWRRRRRIEDKQIVDSAITRSRKSRSSWMFVDETRLNRWICRAVWKCHRSEAIDSTEICVQTSEARFRSLE